MSGDQIDLDNPEQLAALLNITLSDNDDTPDELASALELRAEHVDEDDGPDDDVDDVPRGVDDDALPPAFRDGRGGGRRVSDDVPDFSFDRSPDPDAGVGPDEEPVTESPNSLRRGGASWNDMQRRGARGRHTTYRLHATHSRSQPIEATFTGECQSVRVSLPQSKPDPDSYIGTYIGRVEASDHLLFSIDEVRTAYQLRHGMPPAIERVDLITGARFMGRRFSPVSCYMAYADANAPGNPTFFILEAGSATGKPKALYVARDMETVLHDQSAFAFTPLSCPANWYTGGLRVEPDGHPSTMYLTSAQERDGSYQYFSLEVRYAVERKQKRVISPLNLQIEAAMRVYAIAQQAGCELGIGRGGGMQPMIGPMAEGIVSWDVSPRGRATVVERNRYCGCPKSGR